MNTFGRRTLLPVTAALLIGLTACTGGGDQDQGQSSLPLPDKAPYARGPAAGPEMQPKVLLAASDELEEMTGSLDTALVERRSGAFISGKTVVGYSVDNISGYDVGSGDLLWTAKLDLGAGTVCFVSQPDRAVKTFTVAYGESGFCPRLATIRVSDGTILKKSEALRDSGPYEGKSAGGTVNHLLTIKGRDYLIDMHGVVWKMVKGEPDPFARLETSSYFTLDPTPRGDTLIGSRLSDEDGCFVDGYDLPSFKHTWTMDNATLFPEAREDCVISTAPGNSAWLVQDAASKYYMVQVDPATGKVLGRDDAPQRSGGEAAAGELDLASASQQFDRALGLPNGDTIFAQTNGLTRYSLKTKKVAWDLDLSGLQMGSDRESASTAVVPQGVTADGYLVASISNDTSVELLAIKAASGKLVGRWSVPAQFRNGFQVQPGMALFEGGVVLTRNFEAWERAFDASLGVKEPAGATYDIGVFTFPQPDAALPPAVPVAGPADDEVVALGGAEAPRESEGRGAGSFSVGGGLIAYGGNVLSRFDTGSGNRTWTIPLDDDPGARVCTIGRPDQKVKTFTVAYRRGGEDARCTTVLRVSASDGKILERVDVPSSAGAVTTMGVVKGTVHIITEDAKVRRIVDGDLVEHARLAHLPYSFRRTPQDPTLVVSTSSIEGGRDWAIDAYRMPSYEPVWSTTASAAFDTVDRRNPVVGWKGNGLWISTTLGESSSEGAKDSLVQLDADTGEVLARTGPVERDRGSGAGDLGRFDLTTAAASAYGTVGLPDGDVVVPQRSGIMRYSLADEKARWTVDTTSIMESMEGAVASTTQQLELIHGGRTILVTLSNGTAVELMTLKASDGTITGRWDVPTDSRNGLQAAPGVTPFTGGVALSHNDYAWDAAFDRSGRTVPPEQRYDVGLLRLPKPKQAKKE